MYIYVFIHTRLLFLCLQAFISPDILIFKKVWVAYKKKLNSFSYWYFHCLLNSAVVINIEETKQRPGGCYRRTGKVKLIYLKCFAKIHGYSLVFRWNGLKLWLAWCSPGWGTVSVCYLNHMLNLSKKMPYFSINQSLFFLLYSVTEQHADFSL